MFSFFILASVYCTRTFSRISKCNADIGWCFGYPNPNHNPKNKRKQNDTWI